MVELETRELEYFVAVAEELHFGRAAARLSIAQPALSKTIRRLESRLGTPLLVRSSHGASLTSPGLTLLRDARIALDAIRAAAANTRAAADPERRLRLVTKPGGDANLLSGIVDAYARQADARPVDVLFSTGFDRVEYLRDGRADLALLYAPFDDLTGLAHETLRVEDRVALLRADHPLATRSELLVTDLDGETLPHWTGTSERGDGPEFSGDGPEVTDVPELTHLVALGRVVGVLPRSLVEPVAPGLVCVPVVDAPASRMVIAWPERDHRPALATFVQAALESRGCGGPRRPRSTPARPSAE